MTDLNIFTLSHTGTTGTAFWLYFEYTCNNINPDDYEQLHAILLAEGMTTEAANVKVCAIA